MQPLAEALSELRGDLHGLGSLLFLYPVALVVLLVLVLHGTPGNAVGAIFLTILILCGVEGLLVDLLGVLGQVVLDAVWQLSDLLVGHLDRPFVACPSILTTPCLRPIGAGLTLSKDSVEKREGRSPAKPGSRPRRGLYRVTSMLGTVLKLEGDLHVDLVANYVAVLDHDVHVLHPAALHAPERLGGSGYGLVYGLLEALLRDGAKFCDSGNAHTF